MASGFPVLAMQEEMGKLLRSILEVKILPEVISVTVKAYRGTMNTISAVVSAVQAHFNEDSPDQE